MKLTYNHYIEKLARFVDNDHWFPTRQKVYRMLKAHKSVIPDVDYWTRILPPFKEYIEHQFDDEYIIARRLAKIEERKNPPSGKRIKRK
jgi:hypothetical protein